MIIDGRAIAQDILAEVKKSLPVGPMPVVRAIVVAPSPATQSYLKIKTARAHEAGMELEVVQLPDDSMTEEVIRAINQPGADSIIVQLPLPDAIDTDEVLRAIPLALDADVLSPEAHELFDTNASGALLPPVVAAVEEILTRSNVDVKGKSAAVVGKGWLVGAPVATWLRAQSANVSVLTKESAEEEWAHLKEVDIIVSGAGSPGIIRPEHLKQGVVLIDAGTSESGGAVVGDAMPTCAEIASVFTPVPGGVGPIAVACLFKNAATLINKASLHPEEIPVH